MHFIPDTILRALCWTLLHSLWQGLVFAGLAGVVLVITRKSAAAVRYNLLCGGLAVFLVVSGATFYHELGINGAAPVSVRVAGPAVEAARTPETRVDVGKVGVTGGVDALVGYFNRNAAVIVLIWGIVLLARWVKLLSGWVYTQRIRHYQNQPAPEQWQLRLQELLEKLRISRPVSLLESALVKVPVVVGALRPVILVPVGMLANLSAAQVESILLHELAHIRRKDYLFNLAQHIVDTLFFFNPALLWVSSVIRAERENCCDDIAIRESGSRRRLIEALISFHEYGQSSQGYAMGFAAKENEVVRRVKRIVEKTNHSLNRGERVLLVGGLMVVCAAFVTINGSRAEVKANVKTRVEKKTMTAPVVEKKKPVRVSEVRQRAVLRPVETVEVEKDTVVPEEDPFHGLPVDKLIECRDHGVTPEFIKGFRKMGYTLTIDKAIELVDHGVTTDFIAGFIAEGYASPISLDQALELRDHGVSVGFIKELHGLGFTNISLDKATELVDHGVTIAFIDSWKKKIGKTLELNDYIKLRDAGISPHP